MTLLAGRYRLLATLGQGGMGTVWRATDELLRQEVAVKEIRLPPDLDEASRVELAERTLREARAAAALRSHPSIVTVHDVVLDGGRPWIVMELVRGRSLDRAVRDDGPLPPPRVAEIGLRMIDALTAAHAAGILHRDVKPANVMLTGDGRVLLTDFGIATIAGDAGITQTGMLTGSPGYMAPERLRGEADGPLADLWSLGATLFTAVEGGPPFSGPNQAAVLAAVLMQDHAPFRLAGPLTPVLAAMLEKDPARRCSVEEAAGWLDAVARGDATTGIASSRKRIKLGRPPRRVRRQVMVGAALAVVLVMATGVALVPQMFPGVIRLLGFALASPPTYSPPTYSPRPVPSSPTATPQLISRDFEACDLLTGRQMRTLFGGTMERRFLVASNCSWRGRDGTLLSLSAMRSPSVSTAAMIHEQTVSFMKDEPRRTAGTKVREGPDVGDEAFSHTGKSPFSWGRTLYDTKISFRVANVWVNLTVTAGRPGYATADRAAGLVEKALLKYR
ncbi:serine/threonine-protein kinase [Nonomuraea indica]|uniref:serine/threonine-protein kinase n=1 Tax=Nonomuraea indica TaxID=1581193 RepID=UPI000C7BD631|nr:serine/threonine-protein kinase [Nonomuraea indica]